MERPHAIISTLRGKMKRDRTIKRADYGIDAPGVVRGLFIVGILLLIASILSIWLMLVGLACLIFGSSMLWSSKVGKFRMRDRLIDSIEWQGDEKVLDVGCGHGLLLIAAAKRWAISARYFSCIVRRDCVNDVVACSAGITKLATTKPGSIPTVRSSSAAR